MDYSIEPDVPVPKFKSVSLTGGAANFFIIGRCIFGQIADCRLPTSCNVNQNCVFFSFLFAHSPNQPRQAEDILVHGVPSTRGEGYFAMIL